MFRFIPMLLVSIAVGGLASNAFAESATSNPSKDIAPMLEQNRVVADVARDDPNEAWELVRKINILATGQRDAGKSRSGTSPTPAESAQIAANPALHVAYERDPAATLALLRATNAELQRARLRDEQVQPRRVALVVGGSGDGAWGRLATPGNDANLIAATLARQGFKLVQGGAVIDADKPHLLQAIKEFSRSIGPGTVALFYYAGHGVQLDGRNFMVPAGATVPRSGDEYDRNLVSLDDTVLRQMQQAHGRLNIIVLDACRDPPPAMSRAVASSPGSHGFKVGLAPMGASSATSGSLIIFSTGPNQIARDSVNGEPDSPFASAFASAIDRGGLEIRDVFDRVETSVAQATGHQQEPWISYSSADKFYFNPTYARDETAVGSALDPKPAICPPSGTPIQLVRPGGPMIGTYQAVDPADPELCRISMPTGESINLLYNIYDTKFLIDDSAARTQLNSLLSGLKDHVTFEVRVHTYFGVLGFSESWTRLGEEPFLLDNHYTEALVLERDRRRIDVSYGVILSGILGAGGLFPPKRWKLAYVPTKGIVSLSELQPRGDDGNQNGANGAQVITAEPY